MQSPADLVPGDLGWLTEMGLSARDLHDLVSCVPGEFTDPDGLYVNTATPRITYRGTREGTLPLVTGRWYLIPLDVANRFPQLGRDAVHVARAKRLSS
jgi:hypothetical protein